MKTENDILNLWSTLPGEYGEYFSIKESSVAAVQANRFILWENGEKKFEALTSMECGSYPRFAGSEIFWNDNRWDPQSRNIFNMGIMKMEFFENPVMPDPALKMNSGYKPVTFAWSVESDFLVVSVEGSDSKGDSHSRLMLLNNDGTLRNILWDGRDFGPKAICINSEYIIAGTRDTMIFRTDGKPAGALPGELIAQRIHISENGKLLMIQNYGSIVLWETGCWKRKAVMKGPWLNAALSRDGNMIYAIDFKGRLNAATISDQALRMMPVNVPDPMATIDAGEKYIVASFARGDPVRWVRKTDLDITINKVIQT